MPIAGVVTAEAITICLSQLEHKFATNGRARGKSVMESMTEKQDMVYLALTMKRHLEIS